MYLVDVVDDQPCPREREIITRDFFVDPISRTQVPVRVVQVLQFHMESPPVTAVLVTREP